MVDVDDMVICLACLSSVCFELDSGDERKIAGAITGTLEKGSDPRGQTLVGVRLAQGRRVGTLAETELRAIDNALKVVLGLF